ncbi:MAG: alpha/beta fold hydrolase [Hellea sp.]
MGRKTDDKSLIKETYAASLQPERLEDFEKFWETYIDSRHSGTADHSIEDDFLKSHFSMALGIAERIRHEKEDEDYFQRLVMNHPGFALIIDKDGKIIFGNPDANQFTDNASSIHGMPLANADVKTIIKWCAGRSERTLSGNSEYLFKDVDWGNNNVATLMVAPIALPKTTPQLSKKSDQYYLLSRIDLEVTEAVLPPIREKFSLTQSEAVIAMHVANGMSVKEICKLRETSEQTVRSQVKQVLAKTNARDLADLVRLMLSLSAKFNSVTSQNRRFETARINNELTRIYNLILPDGRYFEYAEQGHPNGKPVLHFHCITKGITFTDKCAKMAAVKGWRIISPYRAGICNSDANLKKTPSETLTSAANDYKFLMQSLGIEKALLLSSWGGHFAQRFANLFPELVQGLLLVSTVPVWHRNYMNYLKSRPRVIVKTAYYAPTAAPYMLRVAKALVDSGRSRYFVAKVDEEREDDLASLHSDKDVLDTMGRGFEEIFKQGTSAFLAELKAIITNWEDDSRKITVPVTVLRGGKVANKPDSAYEEYQQLVPHAKSRIIKDAGVYMQYTFFEQLLEELSVMHGNKTFK